MIPFCVSLPLNFCGKYFLPNPVMTKFQSAGYVSKELLWLLLIAVA